MTMIEKRLIGVKVEIKEGQSLLAFDPVMLENRGGLFLIRKADLKTETPHAILNSDCEIRNGTIYVPAWWHKALMMRYEAEHNHG